MTTTPIAKIGQEIGGRYRLMAHLGGGGFGQTYLAEDLHLPDNPRCVVKHLKPQLDDHLQLDTATRLFEAEARVLYQLSDCDRIPRLFAHFEEDGEFYLVQEYINGANLNQEIVLGHQHGESYVLDMLHNVLEILVNIHNHNVIHRDIKPSNLIRRNLDHQLVLIDFGAVKQLGNRVIGATGHTTRTIAIGSPGYMPNEQFAGKPKLSSDLYALGMMGIQALTGLHPKKLPEDPRTGEIHWRDQCEVSAALADVIDKMVRYDFRDRYPSATEALATIHQLHPHYASLQRPHRPASQRQGHLFQTTLPSHEVFLDSERGLNYRPLQALLKAGQWEAANQETLRLLLAGDRPVAQAPLTQAEIVTFPGRDLRTLDYLWSTHSQGRFGFGTQLRLWREVGGRTDVNYASLPLMKTAKRSGWKVNGPLERFGLRVQWRDRQRWLPASKRQFTPTAPEGHLPAWQPEVIKLEQMMAFFARLETCLL